MGYNIKCFFIYNWFMISTHVPRVGYNPITSHLFATVLSFQLTYPVWGTTKMMRRLQEQPLISTHVPRVGYNHSYSEEDMELLISTHVPRVGYNTFDFANKCFFCISTHVPRVGYNTMGFSISKRAKDFNSRTPCGVQP